jgi:transcriptional regulator with XRE-family HTH domain
MAKEIRIAKGIGKRLRAERKRLALTQEQLATRIGVTTVTIFAYEHETSPMTVPTLIKLAEVGINLSRLLEGSRMVDAPLPDADFIRRLVEKLWPFRKQLMSDPRFEDQAKFEALLTGFAAAASLQENVENVPIQKNSLARKRG